MSRKALALFIGASVIWGSSFLFIRVAVRDIPPAALVFGRTVLAALLYQRWLADTPPLGVSALMMVFSSAVFALPAPLDLPPRFPGPTSVLALATLGIINTGVLSWLYFGLVREAGAAVTSVITYLVPVVALVLGFSLLGENLTTGAVIGMILVALGTWLSTSTRHPRLDPRPAGGGGTDTG